MKVPKKYFTLAKKYANSDFEWVTENDQFGNTLETELNILYETEKEIKEESEELVEYFPVEGEEESSDSTEPINEYDLGYITDFSKILNFGIDGSGCQFCMDFSVGEEPRIIFWDDGSLTWRVIANTIEDFFALFHKEE
ncbi:MAG: SMI1/KNR4 family protein [Capnocytophaga sp.]|nr:SMI1/KNR4 family protein [Capnocytophaga sp.]